MGGTMKGAAHGNCRRKWSSSYVVMAIVCCVLGCGILGLMGIQRLKERASFNVIIKERDDQIVSLHLLLQKERELAAETRRSEKAKASELESTASSLREEQRAVDSAFRERANLMREKCDQQLEALREELSRREGEIEELKLRLQLGSSNATATAAAEAKEVIETSTGSGGEVEATGEKGHEHEKAAEEETEAERSPRRIGGRLRRAKGRRWRLVGKQMQGKRNESALGEAEKSSETKVEAREGEETGEVIEKPEEEKKDIDVSGRKGGGGEENGDQGEESEGMGETNEPEI